MRTAFLFFGLLAAAMSHAVVLFSPDTFESGTFQGWGGNGPGIATEGALGSSRSLHITSGAFGGGRNLATYNGSANYSGNWEAAGATGLRFWVKNLTSTPLNLRLVLFNSSGGQWTSTTGIGVAGNLGWTQYVLGINDLTLVAGSGTLSSTLQNVQKAMLRHDTGTPSAGGTNVDGSAFFDNIEVVPEPSSLLGMITLAGLALKRFRR